MNHRVTAKDVARLSGVSAATVSYVLNNAPGQTISQATRERVRAAAEQLAFIPSAAAAALRRGHSRTVIILTEPALSGFVTEPFLRAIAERLVEDKLVPIVYRFVSDKALLALIDEIRPFGVLAPLETTPTLVSALEASGVPQIYASSRGELGFRRPWEEQIGSLQARHLMDSGVNQLLYAHPTEDNPRIMMSRSREIGARQAFSERFAAKVISLHLPPTRAEAAARLNQALAGCDGIPGISAFDDEVAAVAVAAARELGLKVPADLQVIGVDDNTFAALVEPPLTTIAIDARASGRSLAERFLGAAPTDDARDFAGTRARVVIRSTTQHNS
jgi:DNA-binding LacI/PurR family transcriptional regulator